MIYPLLSNRYCSSKFNFKYPRINFICFLYGSVLTNDGKTLIYVEKNLYTKSLEKTTMLSSTISVVALKYRCIESFRESFSSFANTPICMLSLLTDSVWEQQNPINSMNSSVSSNAFPLTLSSDTSTIVSSIGVRIKSFNLNHHACFHFSSQTTENDFNLESCERFIFDVTFSL